jgi:hypothetical protein
MSTFTTPMKPGLLQLRLRKIASVLERYAE